MPAEIHRSVKGIAVQLKSIKKVVFFKIIGVFEHI